MEAAFCSGEKSNFGSLSLHEFLRKDEINLPNVLTLFLFCFFVCYAVRSEETSTGWRVPCGV